MNDPINVSRHSKQEKTLETEWSENSGEISLWIRAFAILATIITLVILSVRLSELLSQVP